MTTVTQSPCPNNFDALLEAGTQRLLELQAEAATAPREPLATGGRVVEIDGRDWQVTDRLTVEQLPARAANMWRRDGVVAHVEVRRPRGRSAYIARQYADGSFSRPWRGALTIA